MQVHLQVFDMLGRPVESILNQTLPSGFYRVDYDAAAPGGNGMYIIKLAVGYQGQPGSGLYQIDYSQIDYHMKTLAVILVILSFMGGYAQNVGSRTTEFELI